MSVEIEKAVENNSEAIAKSIGELEGAKSDIAKSIEAVDAVSKSVSGIEKSVSEAGERIGELEATVKLFAQAKGASADACPFNGNPREFLEDVMAAGMGKGISERLSKTVGSDEARGNDDPSGGFLVPETFLSTLLETPANALQTDTGQFTMNVPMGSPTVKIPARVDKTHTASVTGGLVAYRRDETDEITASNMTVEQIRLEAKSLGVLSYATEELLTDSPITFASMLQRGMGDTIRTKLNYERIWGAGTDGYLGVMNSPALITVAKETTQAADTIVADNIFKMIGRCYDYSNAVWMVNQSALPQLMGLNDASGNVVWINNLRDGAPLSLMGRPVYYDENCAALGDLGDIILVNWNEYLEGQIGGESLAESMHVRFVNNERAFRVTTRNDGKPWWTSTLIPKKGVTLSPFVALAARA